MKGHFKDTTMQDSSWSVWVKDCTSNTCMSMWYNQRLIRLGGFSLTCYQWLDHFNGIQLQVNTSTYVKSWRMTRAGLNGTSTVWVWVCFQSRILSTSERFTRNSSQFRTADSRRTRIENGRRSEEQIDTEWNSLEHSNYSVRQMEEFVYWFSKEQFTISGISKFRKIKKLLCWVFWVQRLNYMLKWIFHSLRHFPLCGSTDLNKEMQPILIWSK